MFILGLFLFILPSFWQGESRVTLFINSLLGWSWWAPLDNLSLTFYMVAPMVIGFTTYSMQNSIYYDLETIVIYLSADLALIIIISLLALSAIENQLFFISKWIQIKTFGE
eukprot:GHVR01061918.1.p2 GENE.GHVR01061918.1~~GHVR01061918.1.p2  ORF type:complete len:111 (-),score=0.58 GHVR01061918.1:1475-1807(-)